MKKRNPELYDVVSALMGKELGLAFSMLENYGLRYPELGIVQSLSDIKCDYNLMTGYWEQGYKDEHLEELYDRFIQRTYRLTTDTYIRHSVIKGEIMASPYRKVRSSGRNWDIASMRSEMEGFITNLAMLELEPLNKQKEQKRGIYERHARLMDELFDYVRTSPQWTDGMGEEITELLLLPTIDSNDKQLIISAIMLGLMWVYDINKWKVLTEVYQKTEDERVRQRALVGWVCAMGVGYDLIFPEQKTIISTLLTSQEVLDELADLQIQMIYCANAEDIHRKIQDEIMPELMKHNNFRITPNGIEEKDEDTIEDILDYNASERNMAVLEEQFQKMKQMQAAGSDIYFGGFSQMKRFPFFNNVSNWFIPFNIEHPAITTLYQKESDVEMVNMVIDNGSFCDSDKYSFVLGFHQAIDRLPASVREMLSSSKNAMGMGHMGFGGSSEDRGKPAYIRRIYLQDIYRFFKLYPLKNDYPNPFEDVFFSNKIFKDSLLNTKAVEISAFLVKQKMLADAQDVLDCCGESIVDYNYCMLRGYISKHISNDSNAAKEWYAKALQYIPDDIKALSGYARALFDTGEYAEANGIYERLLLIDETNVKAMLNQVQCLIYLEHFDEAAKLLYQIDYKYPENPRIERLMIKIQLASDKKEQAERLSKKLVNNTHALPADSITLGVIYWCKGEIQHAVKCFADYLNLSYPSSTVSERYIYCEQDIIKPYKRILVEHGLTETDILIMKDKVSNH